MKQFVLLSVAALALAGCASAKPALAPASSKLQVPSSKAAAGAPAPKPPSDLSGFDLVAHAPDGWMASTGPDGRPEEGSIGSIRHVETGAVILLYVSQSWTRTPTSIMKDIEANALAPMHRTVTARGGDEGDNPARVWITWEGLSDDETKLPIKGKIAVARHPAPLDDVTAMVAGAWPAEDARLEQDFDMFISTVDLVPKQAPPAPKP